MQPSWKNRAITALKEQPLSRIELSSKIFLNMADIDELVIALFNEGLIIPVDGKWAILKKK